MGFISGWERFWFAPQQTSTLAVFRIVFGLVATGWTVSLIPNLFAFFERESILPSQLLGVPGVWGLLAVSTSQPVIIVLLVTTLAGTLALTVGLRTRLAAVVVFVGILSFERANPMVGNAGDGLLRNLALFCALTPSGAALSLDRLRTAPGHFWEFPARAPWALRLIQIQLSVVYFSSVWHKVQGDHWRDGTAVSYALRIADIHRFPTPSWVTDSVIVSEIFTFGTLALELGLAVLVWNRTARTWILSLGVMLHLMIEYSILIGFFSLTILTAYLAFLPPKVASRCILTLRDHFSRRPRMRQGPGEPAQIVQLLRA
jgi:vitamin K-dependent gamma-carboxylase-like protein